MMAANACQHNYISTSIRTMYSSHRIWNLGTADLFSLQQISLPSLNAFNLQPKIKLSGYTKESNSARNAHFLYP